MAAKLVMGKKAQTPLKEVFVDEATVPFELNDAQWEIPEAVNGMQVDALRTPSPMRANSPSVLLPGAPSSSAVDAVQPVVSIMPPGP
eukprot:1303283-Amphidinium_carterae.1